MYDEGGGGAGGRITVNYVEGVFHSKQTSAYGGTANGNNVENGGPGIVYLFGQRPLNKNLRIDNRGKPAVVKYSSILLNLGVHSVCQEENKHFVHCNLFLYCSEDEKSC